MTPKKNDENYESNGYARKEVEKLRGNSNQMKERIIMS